MVTLSLAQEELSDALGIAPTHIIRGLKRLRDEVSLAFAAPFLKFRDVKRLHKTVGSDATNIDMEPQRDAVI